MDVRTAAGRLLRFLAAGGWKRRRAPPLPDLPPTFRARMKSETAAKARGVLKSSSSAPWPLWRKPSPAPGSPDAEGAARNRRPTG